MVCILITCLNILSWLENILNLFLIWAVKKIRLPITSQFIFWKLPMEPNVIPLTWKYIYVPLILDTVAIYFISPSPLIYGNSTVLFFCWSLSAYPFWYDFCPLPTWYANIFAFHSEIFPPPATVCCHARGARMRGVAWVANNFSRIRTRNYFGAQFNVPTLGPM